MSPTLNVKSTLYVIPCKSSWDYRLWCCNYCQCGVTTGSSILVTSIPTLGTFDTGALHWVPISMPTHAHGFWVGMGAIVLFMGEHGHECDIISNIIGNVTIFEYMGAT